MATYAVGDIQGCLEPLQRLLEQLNFNPATDQLWSVGDTINRGPDSLGTLRFLYNLGDAFRMVLGNHDLHLLAVYNGHRAPNRKDTLNEILNAPDADQLCGWLQQQPLLYQQGDWLMSHAGVPAIWTVEQAHGYATEVQQVLQSPQAQDYFAAMYGNEPAGWDENLQGETRWRVITNYLTRMRFCDTAGNLNLTSKGPTDTAPDGFAPWFSYPVERPASLKLLFGHWASIQGHTGQQNIIALDTGCVWGGPLRILELETGQLHHYQA